MIGLAKQLLLAGAGAVEMFSVVPLLHRAAAPQSTLVYTDWTLVPGRVLYQGAAGERTLLQAAAGSLYNVVVGPDGVVYASDANTNDLMRWSGGQFTLVYHHTTYVRDIAFDAQGRLYFSEATGGGADGKIFRLDDGVATSFYTVSLASVGGFWAGHFNFAPDGTLYLSSGNRIPSSVYKVIGVTPMLLFTDPAGSIAGFDFDASGNLYYADWSSRIYKMTPALAPPRTVALEIPGRRLSDVDVVDRSIALGPEAGRLNGIAFHPTNSQILYAAASTGGVFRSYDGGKQWFLRTRGISHPQTDGILVHPSNPTTVFAATPGGVFRSLDEGLSWARVLAGVQSPDPPFLLRAFQNSPIRFDPLDGSIYAAPFCAGLYRSVDGVTWTMIYPVGLVLVTELCVTSIDVSPSNGGTVYVTTPSGIWRRVGGGAWTQIGTEINDATPVVLRVAPSDPNRIYVGATALVTWPPNTNLWMRATAGAAFVRTATAPPWLNWSSSLTIAVHPTDPLRVYFGSVALYGTTDAVTWAWTICASSLICGLDYHGLTFDRTGASFYAPHDQGLYRLDLAASTFTPLEGGLVNTQFYDTDVSTNGTVYGGTQDMGAWRRPSGATWTRLSTGGSGDVLDLLAHPADPMRLFVRTNSEDLLRSSDQGATFQTSGFLPSQGFWNHQLAYHAGTSTLYAGTQFAGVYKSTDDGATFLPANNGITTKQVRCLALQPGGGSNTVAYAGTFTQGVFKTIDGGGSWSQLTAFPESGALVFASNPGGTRLYAGTRNGVYRSADGGASWSSNSTGLPANAVVSELVVDPVCPCLMYAGLGYSSWDALSGGGVFASSDGGATWSALTASDESYLSVPAIRIDPLDRSKLYVGTYGSGVRILFRDVQSAGGCAC